MTAEVRTNEAAIDLLQGRRQQVFGDARHHACPHRLPPLFRGAAAVHLDSIRRLARANPLQAGFAPVEDAPLVGVDR